MAQIPGLGLFSNRSRTPRFLLCISLLDAVQILVLSFVPSPGAASASPSALAVVPPPSAGFFLHVFFGNALWGVQELIPVYSAFALARSLYSLFPAVTLLGTAWHLSPAGVMLRLLAFAYSWLELSSYSYATLQSFVFIRRIRSGSLTWQYVLRTCVIMVVGLALAATLEVMAANVLWT